MFLKELEGRRRFLGGSAATLALGTFSSRGASAQSMPVEEPHVGAPPIDFKPGGYRYLPDVFQYSGGVVSLPGFAMVRVRLRAMATLQDGYKLIEEHLKRVGRPSTALCSIELRSPRPFTEEGFIAFNTVYVKTLERWGLYKDGKNPVARNNVCPERNKPDQTRLFAFTYTVKAQSGDVPGFQIAGSAETPEAIRTKAEPHIVAPGDISPAGILIKAKWVIAEMQSRLKALDLSWEAATATDVYTVHDINPFISTELVECGASLAGVTWQYARPPVDTVDFEMGIRGASRDLVLA